jgi:hypothetical protein
MTELNTNSALKTPERQNKVHKHNAALAECNLMNEPKYV